MLYLDKYLLLYRSKLVQYCRRVWDESTGVPNERTSKFAIGGVGVGVEGERGGGQNPEAERQCISAHILWIVESFQKLDFLVNQYPPFNAYYHCVFVNPIIWEGSGLF